MKLGDQFHLSYCTNIHPGQDWETTLSNLKKYVPAIKSDLAPNAPFGLGLRLSNQASVELEQHKNLIDFKHWLSDQNCYIFTMNGFPYGNFHNEAVKDKVHLPDWTDIDRLGYTKRLFEQLAYLIPEEIDGGISTSPISYKHWCTDDKAKIKILHTACNQLVALAMYLRELEQSTGSYLHLDIEPEPDGFLENTSDVLIFYKDYLLPIGSQILIKELGVSKNRAEELLLRYICICYDICHFSLAYEEPESTFSQWSAAGIDVGKIQISAALKILAKDDIEAVWNSLARFNEPTYLHQVTQRTQQGLVTYGDLPQVLREKPDFEELRAHFHVPVFLDSFDKLHSTQDHILKVFTYLQKHDITRHLEVETYTWEVLPAELKTEIGESVSREIRWVLNHLLI
ncbi:MAG: metabolite traffic protein EboE [Flavobacteriaceae bacterium]